VSWPDSAVLPRRSADQCASQRERAAARHLAFTRYSNEHVELSAITPITAYVVLSDVFYPGWTATIDDQPAQVYPANFAFRAVLVPPGEHRVTFTFEPVTWRVGLAISWIRSYRIESSTSPT
jgi:uncharacterized membrane protein YfhO